MAEVQKIQDDDRDVIVRTTQETKSSNFLSYILWPPFPRMTCTDALMQRLHGCNGAAPVLHGIRPPWMAEVQKMQEQFSVLHPVAAVPAHDVHGRTNAAIAWMQWSCPCAPRHTTAMDGGSAENAGAIFCPTSCGRRSRTSLCSTAYLHPVGKKKAQPLGCAFKMLRLIQLMQSKLKTSQSAYISDYSKLERETRLELATPTLARLCSTN